MLTDEELLQVLVKMNPWWQTNQVPNHLKKDKNRKILSELQSFIDEDRITSLIGLRRVGKTTLLYQLIDHLLDDESKENVLYASLDDVTLIDLKKPVKRIFEVYKNKVKKDEGMTYLFLDEIEFDETWELELKNIWDRENVKIFISGSSSLKIKRSKESLVGRIHTIRLPPLSFYDFMSFDGVELDMGDHRKEFQKRLLRGSEEAYDAVENCTYELNLLKEDARSNLNRYLIRGGFPETFSVDKIDIWQRFLKEDVVDRVLFRDIPEIHDVRDRKLLVSLIQFVAAESSSLFSYNSLSQDLGARNETISNYMTYLENSFLVHIHRNYTSSYQKKIRSRKKIYMADTGLRYALLNKDDEILSDAREMGVGIENLIAIALESMADRYDADLFYWRDKYEVDFVLEKEKPVPIEVKYKKEIRNSDLRGLKKFKEEHGEDGIVITKDRMDYQNDMVFIPAWAFLTLA